ncbi:MAG: hypothetical protein WKF84_30070 [Pyrinomonadaceae bacterium]
MWRCQRSRGASREGCGIDYADYSPSDARRCFYEFNRKDATGELNLKENLIIDRTGGAPREVERKIASRGSSGDSALDWFHPLIELTKTRLREFLREPEAVFWVFVFPVLLACALGIAFRSTGPEKVRVAIESSAQQQSSAAEELRIYSR